MNHINMEECCKKFHLGTVAVVEKLVGIPEREIEVYPIVVKKDGELIFYILGKYGAVEESYIHSYILNGAFSLEVLMKFLHQKETGAASRGHNLSDLYDGMTKETKQAIGKSIAKATNGSSLHDQSVLYFRNEHDVSVEWSASFLLEKSDLAFERWRYIFEEKLDPTWFIGYKELREAFLSRLAELS